MDIWNWLLLNDGFIFLLVLNFIDVFVQRLGKFRLHRGFRLTLNHRQLFVSWSVFSACQLFYLLYYIVHNFLWHFDDVLRFLSLYPRWSFARVRWKNGTQEGCRRTLFACELVLLFALMSHWRLLEHCWFFNDHFRTLAVHIVSARILRYSSSVHSEGFNLLKSWRHVAWIGLEDFIPFDSRCKWLTF